MSFNLPPDQGLLAYTLRSRGERRELDDAPGDIRKHKAEPKIVAIAETVIEQPAGDLRQAGTERDGF